MYNARRSGLRFFDEVRRIGRLDAGAIRATLDFVIPRLKDPMPEMSGFGIVTVGGGKYLKYIWNLVRKARVLTDAPIICYHLGPDEVNHPAVSLLKEMDVEFRDAIPIMRRENYTFQGNKGWSAKSAAIMDCPFKEVLFLDADAYPLMEPESILDHWNFSTGFLAFPDIQHCRKNDMLFTHLALKRIPDWVEAEAGQFLVDRSRFWKEIQLYSFMNGRPLPFHDLAMGDKTLLQLSCMKLGTSFNMGGKPEWVEYGIRHHLTDGTPAFMHSMPAKRGGMSDPAMEEALRQFEELSLQTV